MNNYSSECEYLNIEEMVTERDGKVELTDEAMKKATDYSEGNSFLCDALTSCWKHNIKTYACCCGHEGDISNDNTNLFPYIGIVLDNNSLPYIKNIIASLQNIKDVEMSSSIIRAEDSWGPDVPDYYKAFAVHCCLSNRCEVFYKIHKAIEDISRGEVTLSYQDEIGIKAEEFYNKIANFQSKQLDDEEIKNFERISYGNLPQEVLDLQYEESNSEKHNKRGGKFWNRLFHKKEEKPNIDRYLRAQNYYEPTIFEKYRGVPQKSTSDFQKPSNVHTHTNNFDER